VLTRRELKPFARAITPDLERRRVQSWRDFEGRFGSEPMLADAHMQPVGTDNQIGLKLQ
jgi:hypothetical protein